MATPTILGTAGAVEQPRSVGFAPQRGWFTVRTWKGTTGAVEALLPQLVNAGYEFQIDGGVAGIAVVRAQVGSTLDGTGDEPVNIWELDVNAVSKDVLETDEKKIADIPAGKIDLIRAAILDPNSSEAKALTPPFPFQGVDETAAKLYALMQKGVREKVIYQQVLRHTMTVNNTYQVAASNTNVRKILSKSTLNADGDIPGWIYNSMDDGQSHHTDLIYGWYKEPPRITVVSYLKTQIVQQWQFGLWAKLLYGELL